MSTTTIQITNILKTVEVLGFSIGSAVLAFNLFNFTLSQMGIYYKDPAQYGIAAGVFLIVVALIIHNQNN